MNGNNSVRTWRIDRVSWALARVVLWVYAVLFTIGLAATWLPALEQWVLVNDDFVVLIATVAVLCNAAVWVMSLVILASEESVPKRFKRNWIITLVVTNLLGSLAFQIVRRRMARGRPNHDNS